jgi:hypothetical protein
MNEIILAYGLGIVSVGLFVLARVVLKADKKVTEHQHWIESFQREYERGVESFFIGTSTIKGVLLIETLRMFTEKLILGLIN